MEQQLSANHSTAQFISQLIRNEDRGRAIMAVRDYIGNHGSELTFDTLVSSPLIESIFD